MNTQPTPNKSFLIIAILALLWNIMGLFQFIMAAFMKDLMLETYSETYTEQQMELFLNTPSWYYVFFWCLYYHRGFGFYSPDTEKENCTAIVLSILINSFSDTGVLDISHPSHSAIRHRSYYNANVSNCYKYLFILL